MALNGSLGPRNALVDAPPPPLSATSLPRVHVTSARTAASSGLLPLLPRRSPNEVVSLNQPRPDGERISNDYVETPLRGEHHHAPIAPPRPPSRSGGGGGVLLSPPVPAPGLALRSSPASRLPLPTATTGKHRSSSNNHHAGVVTKQPSSSYKKDAARSALEAAAAASSTCVPTGDGVGRTICHECGRCRCESCKLPRPLPERWLCNNSVYCSPEASVDYGSCLCCVKALFYHCSKDYERDDGNCADDPCSCASSDCCARWSCLAALSIALPCLLCYWPLRACYAGFKACHDQATSNRGCRCRPRPPPTVSALTSSASPLSNKALLDGSAADKRLLDSSPDT